MNQIKKMTLKVGEPARLVKTFLKTYTLVYAGETSDRVFSLVPVWTSGYNSAAYNIYFPKSQREIQIFGGRLVVLELSSKHIRFQFEKHSRSAAV